MLLLIIGITGDLGQRLAREALDPRLESFIRSESYGDITALDAAMNGVDAVICAYSTDPILYLDGNLAALRAAERAGVKLFFASSFTNDWTNIKRGDFPIYDPIMSFADQADLTSPIKPVFIINGTFAEWMFQVPSENTFKRTYYGNADKMKTSWTTMDDAAAYTIEILLHEPGVQSGNGGVFRIRSGEHSLREQAEVFERVTGRKMELVYGGDLKDAEKALEVARKKSPNNFWGYLQEAAAVVAVKGLWEFKKPVLDLGQFKKPTTLEEHLKMRFAIGEEHTT